MERDEPRRRRYTGLYLCAFIAYVVTILAIGLFVYPTPSGSGTATPAPITLSPTPPAPSPPPTSSSSPPPVVRSGCKCGPDEQPIYDSFPHPAHTDESYAVFNFYNDGAVDENGEDITIWVSMFITADARMEAADPRFNNSFTYVYVDAVPLTRGQLLSYTMPKAVTAAGGFARAPNGAGRAPGGRIVIYYKNPAEHDELRTTTYGGSYPVQTTNNIEPIRRNGMPAIPSPLFSQLLEFTLDVDPGQDANLKAFIDYDLSAVDTIAIPVYIFGGSDTRTLPGATSGNVNNGFPCGKAYIGCQQTHETTDGCPTLIEQRTPQGSVCLSPLNYCSIGRLTTYMNETRITNKTNWLALCTKFDEIAAGFGITQERLDFFYACGDPNQPTPQGCPPVAVGDITTPSGVIYGCNGKFLLENQCNEDGSRFTRSRLDGSQCSAINRGLCQQPNYRPIPPQGLSCAEFKCSPGAPSCFVNCTDYNACFGSLCQDYSQSNAFAATCDGATCQVGGASTNCVDVTIPKAKFKTPGCNDSSPNPYEQGLIQNDYAAWARSKGERYYAFSLDEEVGGGNQQCLYSTQLDVVIFPRCNGNYVPPVPQ